MKASLIFSSTSHSINVQKVFIKMTHNMKAFTSLTSDRSSKSSSRKHSTFDVQFLKLSMSGNRCYSINPSDQPRNSWSTLFKRPRIVIDSKATNRSTNVYVRVLRTGSLAPRRLRRRECASAAKTRGGANDADMSESPRSCLVAEAITHKSLIGEHDVERMSGELSLVKMHYEEMTTTHYGCFICEGALGSMNLARRNV